jgi:hypothetical protein
MDRGNRAKTGRNEQAMTDATRVRLCWRQHCLEDDFDELLRKGQSRYADQIGRCDRIEFRSSQPA